MLIPQLSQGTFGRVLAFRDDQTDQIARRPIEGKTKVITYTENDIVVDITPSDPEQAVIFGTMRIQLGAKTWDKTIPDVDPLWQQWYDAGLITLEMLTDVPEPPEPDEVILERTRTQKVLEIDAWLANKDQEGIDCGKDIQDKKVQLKSDASAATQLSVYFSTLTPGVDTIVVSDVNAIPHIVSWEKFPELAAAFKTEFNRRRGAWAIAKSAVMQATNLEELNAVAMPQ